MPIGKTFAYSPRKVLQEKQNELKTTQEDLRKLRNQISAFEQSYLAELETQNS